MNIKNLYYSAKEAYGNRKGKKQISQTNIRDKWFTYPANDLTPTSLKAILEEADIGYLWQSIELFQEIEKKDPQIQSCMQVRKLSIVGKEREIKPASEDKNHMKHKEFIEKVFDQTPNFDIFLLSLTEAIGLGFAVNEIMWEVVNGEIGIAELIEVNQTNFTFYDNEKVLTVPRLLTDDNQYDGIELEPKKFVYHRHIPKGRHVSRSGILRTLTWYYLFKNYNIKDWSVFNEVYGMPIRLGKYKPGAGNEEITALETALANIASDTSIVISENTNLEFVQTQSSGGKGATNTYKSMADYCDMAIAKTVLGQTASTEGTPGKLGNEKERGKVRQDILEFDCKRIESTVNEQLIKYLIDYQYGVQEGYPKLKILCDTPEDLNMRAERDHKIRQAFPTTQIPDNYVYDTYGYPEPDEQQKKEYEAQKKQDAELAKKQLEKEKAALPINDVKKKEEVEDIPGVEDVKKKVASDQIALKGSDDLTPGEMDAEITSLKKMIKDMSQTLTADEMATVMSTIGNKITAFEGVLKKKVLKKVQGEIKGLLTGKRTQKQTLGSLEKFFAKKEFEAEGLRKMLPDARARLYMRNELKNVYTDTYHETVKKAFPGEDLYCYSSGPRDGRTAPDSKSVEALTNPKWGGTPLRYPDEWNANPTVQTSLRPNDRGSLIISPLFMLPPDVKKRLGEK